MERASLLPRSSVCVKSSLTVITTFVCDTHLVCLSGTRVFIRPAPPSPTTYFLIVHVSASHNWINARENVLTYRTLGKTCGIVQGDPNGRIRNCIYFSEILSIFLRGRFSKISDLFFFYFSLKPILDCFIIFSKFIYVSDSETHLM